MDERAVGLIRYKLYGITYTCNFGNCFDWKMKIGFNEAC